MSLDDGWCDCRALNAACLPAGSMHCIVLAESASCAGLNGHNDVRGGKRSELSAVCGYECSGIHLQIKPWE